MLVCSDQGDRGPAHPMVLSQLVARRMRVVLSNRFDQQVNDGLLIVSKVNPEGES